MSFAQQSSPERHPRFPTFALPQLDGSLTLPELFEWHSQNSPKHPLYVFEDKPGVLRTIFWGEVIHGLNRAARLCAEAIGGETVKDSKNAPVIAILGSLGSCFSDMFSAQAISSISFR